MNVWNSEMDRSCQQKALKRFCFLLQDLGLAQSAATATTTPTPMGSLAHQIYRIMCNKGYAKLDFSSVFQFLKEDQH